jgi:hypothetical protein
MPGPDPHGIELGSGYPQRLSVLVYHSFSSIIMGGSKRHRLDRAHRILARLRYGWLCLQCRRPVPIYRRADACHCSQGCRKRAARNRRG